jgi:hypothetical protein
LNTGDIDTLNELPRGGLGVLRPAGAGDGGGTFRAELKHLLSYDDDSRLLPAVAA